VALPSLYGQNSGKILLLEGIDKRGRRVHQGERRRAGRSPPKTTKGTREINARRKNRRHLTAFAATKTRLPAAATYMWTTVGQLGIAGTRLVPRLTSIQSPSQSSGPACQWAMAELYCRSQYRPASSRRGLCRLESSDSTWIAHSIFVSGVHQRRPNQWGLADATTPQLESGSRLGPRSPSCVQRRAKGRGRGHRRVARGR
jgi:hypothetical protein